MGRSPRVFLQSKQTAVSALFDYTTSVRLEQHSHHRCRLMRLSCSRRGELRRTIRSAGIAYQAVHSVNL